MLINDEDMIRPYGKWRNPTRSVSVLRVLCLKASAKPVSRDGSYAEVVSNDVWRHCGSNSTHTGTSAVSH